MTAHRRKGRAPAGSTALRAALLLALTSLVPAGAAECVIYSDSFNRANNNALGSNNNALGGTITANWVENDGNTGTVPANHSISNGFFRLYGTGFDSYINHNFTYAELTSKFAIEFDLTATPENTSPYGWCAILLGVDTSFSSGANDIQLTDTPLGLLFRSDNVIVVWDGGFNNSQVPYNYANGWAPASYTGAPRTVRIEIDSPTGLSGTSDNKLRLYLDGVQFNDLRHEGLSEYTFGWNAGASFYISFESSTGPVPVEKYIDNLKILVQNHPPVATNLYLGVQQGGAATMQVIGGKWKPTDADNDTLTVSAVSSPTPAGATVTTDGTSLTVNYSAVASFSGADSFTYTVSDGKCTDTKTVYVNVSPGGTGPNIQDVNINGGTVTVQAFGIPGYTYRLQYTASLTPVNWVDVTGSDQTAAGNGQMTLTGAAGGSGGYYRTRYVSGP